MGGALRLSILEHCPDVQDPTALNRRKARKANERRNELTMQERFQDVKDFWLKQGPTRRRQLLKVPIRRLLQGVHPFTLAAMH